MHFIFISLRDKQINDSVVLIELKKFRILIFIIQSKLFNDLEVSQ